MNSKQFKYVLTIANAGSFSKAADELNISQPSLSQYVKKIENQLDAELFDRTNGNCRLTDAGKVFVDTGSRILALERQMQSQLADINENRMGSVIVGTTPFRSASMMPSIVSGFRKKYPGMHVVVVEQGTQELKESAERGEFDLSIVNLPVDKRAFKYEIIMEEEIVVAVPAGKAFDKLLSEKAVTVENRKYKAVDARLLDRQDFVMITDTQIMQRALDDLCKEYSLALNKAAVVKSLEAQIEMVREGVGAALVPTGIEKFGGSDGRISFYSLTKELPRRKVAVIYRRDKYLSNMLKDLINEIKAI